MHKPTTHHAFLVVSSFIFSIAATEVAAQEQASGHARDTGGTVVKDPYGLCWRTGYWTPSLATPECEPDLVPKPAATAAPEPPPPPAARVEPEPAPVPPPVAPVAAPPPPVVVAPPPPVTEKVTFAADVLFDFDRAVLKPEGQARLDELATKMKPVALEVVVAIGHTDAVGGDDYNQKLSVRRADAVKAYLVSKGVGSDRIFTEGKGKSQPVADNRTGDGRAKNRRVEVEVVGTQQK